MIYAVVKILSGSYVKRLGTPLKVYITDDEYASDGIQPFHHLQTTPFCTNIKIYCSLYWMILVVSMVITLQFAKDFRFNKRNLPPGRFCRFRILVSELSNRSLGFGESAVEANTCVSNRSRPKWLKQCNNTAIDMKLKIVLNNRWTVRIFVLANVSRWK